jgi:hypothetical protein
LPLENFLPDVMDNGNVFSLSSSIIQESMSNC